MAPRAARGRDPEKLQKDYDDFCASEEYKYLQYIFRMRKQSDHELKGLNNGTEDILGEWQEILNSVFKLVEGFKVPGRKAKCKLLLLALSSFANE